MTQGWNEQSELKVVKRQANASALTQIHNLVRGKINIDIHGKPNVKVAYIELGN